MTWGLDHEVNYSKFDESTKSAEASQPSPAIDGDEKSSLLDPLSVGSVASLTQWFPPCQHDGGLRVPVCVSCPQAHDLEIVKGVRGC